MLRLVRGLVDLVPGLSRVVPTGVTHHGVLLPLCLGRLCLHRFTPASPGSHGQQPHPTSWPLLGRAHPEQVPLPWSFPQHGCPCVPSVIHCAAMPGGAVADRHSHGGAWHGSM